MRILKHGTREVTKKAEEVKQEPMNIVEEPVTEQPEILPEIVASAVSKKAKRGQRRHIQPVDDAALIDIEANEE